MKGNPIDKEVFKKAKMMIAAGMKRSDISQILDISEHSVTRISKAESFEGHKANVAIYRKQPEQTEEQKFIESAKQTVSDYYQMNRLAEQMKRQQEQLEQICGYMRECAEAVTEILNLLR